MSGAVIYRVAVSSGWQQSDKILTTYGQNPGDDPIPLEITLGKPTDTAAELKVWLIL